MKLSARLLGVILGFELLVSATIAQPPDTLWTRTYGGSSNDNGLCVQQTSDGGFVVVGDTRSFNVYGRDVMLFKTSSEGSVEWGRTFGGTSGDQGTSVAQTSDGGYIITGYTYSYGSGGYDMILLKTDNSGNEQWSHAIGGIHNDYGYCVQETSDAGFIVAGRTDSYGAGEPDVWLVKTDVYGEEVWSQTFGGVEIDAANWVEQTVDGGFILAGFTHSSGAGHADLWLIKTDSEGNEEWNYTYGGINGDWAEEVQQTSDGGYVVVGRTDSFGAGQTDFLLLKTDADGNEIWTRTFGGPNEDLGLSVRQTAEGGFVIAGRTDSFGDGLSDAWIIKTDSDGNEEWSDTFGGASYDLAFCVRQTTDLGYIAVARTDSYGAGASDVWLLRLANEAPQQVLISVDPVNPPIQIPASGGTFEYSVVVQNTNTYPVTFDAWTEVDLINGNTYGPILLRQDLLLAGDSQIEVSLSQNVPGFLLAGEYTFRGCVGVYPGIVASSGEFTFEKLSSAGIVVVDNWDVSGWTVKGSEETPSAVHPEDISVISVYPNPFNPTTTVTVTLLEPSSLTVTVHNILGKQVSVLANRRFRSGYHQFTLEATDLASGVYFIRASVPNHLDKVQKIALIR